MTEKLCDECEGTGELDGDEEGNYFDCPGQKAGTCNAAEPSDNCPDCEGAGYITEPVECGGCDGSGETL